jgi:hypothetical protein
MSTTLQPAPVLIGEFRPSGDADWISTYPCNKATAAARSLRELIEEAGLPRAQWDDQLLDLCLGKQLLAPDGSQYRVRNLSL